MYAENPNRLLDEMDQIDALIRTLTKQRDDIAVVIDNLTRPARIQSPPQTRKLLQRGFIFHGQYKPQWYLLDLYLSVLRRLHEELPDKWEQVVAALKSRSYTRSYLAKDRAGLFSGKSQAWAEKHSTKLCQGWYADTNLNAERIRCLLPTAVRAAGLKWNEDVRVIWSSSYVTVQADSPGTSTR